MTRMTWKKFKEFIDNELRRQNIDEDVEIEYIDISHPCDDHDMCKPYVGVNEYGVGIST